jgi:hypothetical protein
MANDPKSDILMSFMDSAGGYYLTDAQALRIAQRSLAILNQDILTDYAMSGEDNATAPEMPGEHYELWITRAVIMGAEMLLARAAAHYSYKSGDVSADRHYEATNWKDLIAVKKTDYARGATAVNPEFDSDCVRMSISSRVFARGSECDHHHHRRGGSL